MVWTNKSALDIATCSFSHQGPTYIFPGIVANEDEWNPILAAKSGERQTHFGFRVHREHPSPSQDQIVEDLAIFKSGVTGLEGVGINHLRDGRVFQIAHTSLLVN